MRKILFLIFIISIVVGCIPFSAINQKDIDEFEHQYRQHRRNQEHYKDYKNLQNEERKGNLK